MCAYELYTYTFVRRKNSIAYRQDTSKRQGAQSVNQLACHEVIYKTPILLQHPNTVKNTHGGSKTCFP